MARLFNAYVMVDWSGAAAPRSGKDSIWIGVLKRDIRFRPTFEAFNPPTRRAAEAQLREVLADLRRRGDRALIGFDFALGYPSGTAEMLKLKTPTWDAMWAFLAANVSDKADNANNRFQVAAKMNRLMTDEARPFWGCPPREAQRWLSATKPPAEGAPVPPTLRRTELAAQHLSMTGGGKVQPKAAWQLLGAGSVGSQAIVGVPAVKRMVDELGEKAAVWPFATGWRALSPVDLHGLEALIVEIYPALVPVRADAGEIADRAQVRTLAEHFARMDEQGRLALAFAPPKGTDPETVADVEREEGWILGAG